MTPMTSKLRYTVMVDAAGDSSFGVFHSQQAADDLVLLLSRQDVPARVVTIWPHTTGKTIIDCLRSMFVNPFRQKEETSPAGTIISPVAAAIDRIKSEPPAPTLPAEPERTTYTKVEPGDMVAVDRRSSGLYPAIKRLPRNTEWMRVEDVKREKKRGTTSITIFVVDPQPYAGATTGKITALKWDAAHTAITKKKAN